MPSSEIYSLALHDALPISMPTSPILAAVCICRSAITSEQSTRLLFFGPDRSEEHTSELQSLRHLVCRLPRSTLLPYTTLFRSPCRPVPYSLPSASAGVRSRASRAPVCCSSDLTSGWSLVGPRKPPQDGLVLGGGRRDPVFRQPAYTPPPERPEGSPDRLRRRDSYP